jgi:4-hydroxy-tetrahydrodipicolinate reductase
LTHNAYNRKIFANGAIKAIKWIASQNPGLYSMQDISF